MRSPGTEVTWVALSDQRRQVGFGAQTSLKIRSAWLNSGCDMSFAKIWASWQP